MPGFLFRHEKGYHNLWSSTFAKLYRQMFLCVIDQNYFLFACSSAHKSLKNGVYLTIKLTAHILFLDLIEKRLVLLRIIKIYVFFFERRIWSFRAAFFAKNSCNSFFIKSRGFFSIEVFNKVGLFAASIPLIRCKGFLYL